MTVGGVPSRPGRSRVLSPGRAEFAIVDPGEFSILVPQNPEFPIVNWLFLRFCLYLLSTVVAPLLNRVPDPLSYLMGHSSMLPEPNKILRDGTRPMVALRTHPYGLLWLVLSRGSRRSVQCLVFPFTTSPVALTSVDTWAWNVRSRVKHACQSVREQGPPSVAASVACTDQIGPVVTPRPVRMSLWDTHGWLHLSSNTWRSAQLRPWLSPWDIWCSLPCGPDPWLRPR